MQVEIYTWTYCPYCVMAKRLLDKKNISYYDHVIDNDSNKKSELTMKTGQSTVPYIFIDNEFIGGYNELKQLDKKGNLE